jgi:hypothetical protein
MEAVAKAVMHAAVEDGVARRAMAVTEEDHAAALV